jgi:hypothetical protein
MGGGGGGAMRRVRHLAKRESPQALRRGNQQGTGR